jgi:hypothetical protein
MMLGIEVGRYMVRRGRPPSQGWETFLRITLRIASLDLFVFAEAHLRRVLRNYGG